MEAVTLLENCGIPRARLTAEKAELYEQLAEVNREIRTQRRKLKLCQEIRQGLPQIEQDIERTEARESEVKRDEHWRR